MILDDHGRIPFVLDINLWFAGFLGFLGFLRFGIGPRRKHRTPRKLRKLTFRSMSNGVPKMTMEFDLHSRHMGSPS